MDLSEAETEQDESKKITHESIREKVEIIRELS